MFMQRFLDRVLWVASVLIIIAGLSVVVRAVYEVSIGNGLASVFFGTRGVRAMWVAILVSVGVTAIAGIVASIVAWVQRRRGWVDQNARKP